MTNHSLQPLDSEAAAVQHFKDEGAFLLSAESAAEALIRRVGTAHPNVKTFSLTRDELHQLARQFSRAVATAKDYHLGAAGLPGA